MKKQYGALVVGAGIGGIKAALDIAVTGQHVALIDKRPNHGGILTQLDHQFPTDNCGMCRMLPLMARDSASQFCLRKGLFHENIDLMLSTEMTALEGEPGKFIATLNRHSTLVDPTRCVSCGLCSEVCPVRVPNEFNAGLTQRAAIYLPVPHNIPNHYVVDLDNCKRCWQCFETCPTKAIDFKFEERKDFHILLVGPDPAESGIWMDWIKAQNYPSQQVSKGTEAVDKLSESDRYRLMLLDLSIADMDPERILSRALELRPSLVVVLLVPPGGEDRAKEMLKYGAREILAKPLEPKQFVPWLDKLYLRILSDRSEEIEAAAVILSGGFDCYDPSEMADVLGYGRLPGVLTALEFERLCSGTGPTEGRILVPGTDRPAERIAWIQCVGSRDIKKKADFCSSICCMFSLKEALLAKNITQGKAETSIFYMDMRTFGKGFQQYRDEAVKEHGVRLVRSRPHSVIPTPNKESLTVGYFDDKGTVVDEEFDLVVLATGVRPPKGMAEFASVAGIDTNEFGFCDSPEFTPARTSRLGVFSAGAFGSPKDIAESIIQAGAAAQGASRIIKIYGPLSTQTPEPDTEYPDVSRQAPRVMVTVCAACPTLGKSLDMDALLHDVGQLHSVCSVVPVQGACTQEGWEQIEKLAQEHKPNRIVIGACLPYAYIPKLRELSKTVKLSPALMDVVDVYTPVFSASSKDKLITAADVRSRLAMSVAKLEGEDPLPPSVTVDVAPHALVIGGGLAGMTAAMAIGDHGFDVCLVEQAENLGGTAMRLHSTLQGNDPRKYLEDLIEQVEKHPKIRTLKNARVVFSRGSAGRFQSAVASEQGALVLEHAVTILATGGHEANVYDYGFKVHKSVLSQLELEEKLAAGKIDTTALKGVIMIQCWRSREESRNYCSRVCCSEALKNILTLKRKNPNLPITVFYRDMMAYGFTEKYYTQARKAGVIFVRYSSDNKPRFSFENGLPVVKAFEPILRKEIEVRGDLLVLSGGVEPNEQESLAEVFGVTLDQNGFYQEADPKWRPLDFIKDGIFMCGLARSPGNMAETIASAQASAQRALRILNAKKVSRESVVAEVRHSLCSLCQACVSVCPYGARRVDLENERIVVDEILCQGCGSCAAVCPNSATVLKGYHDGDVLSIVDAALEGIV